MRISKPEEIRGKLVDAKSVVRDLDKVLKHLSVESIDVVTFSGSGEPTLNLELESIAKAVKERIGDLPLAILTNSSLFHKKRVKENLAVFDIVVAKLDAGDEATFRVINRPADVMLTAKAIAGSIKRLKRTINGTIALEVMLLRSTDNRVTNVHGKPLQDLVDTIVDVNPERVQLEVPYRPPSEGFVRIPSLEEVKLVAAKFWEHFKKEQVQVYGLQEKLDRDVKWHSHESLEKEAIELLKRRPCSVIDVSKSMGIPLPTSTMLLKKLARKGLVTADIRKGEKYHYIRSGLSNSHR